LGDSSALHVCKECKAQECEQLRQRFPQPSNLPQPDLKDRIILRVFRNKLK